MEQKVPYPTVGRVVYFFYNSREPGEGPLPMLVSFVKDGYIINGSITGTDGVNHPGTGVPHLSVAHPGQSYWDWMDYQKGQAAKTEQLEQELKVAFAKGNTGVGNDPGPGHDLTNELGKLQRGAPSPEDGKR
jgi:hypothetical protein